MYSDTKKISPITQNLTKTFNSNIFVKFIPTEVSEEEIKKIFSEAGKIISMNIKQSYTNVEGEQIPVY
jgi:RNA recognition motif-containing protein